MSKRQLNIWRSRLVGRGRTTGNRVTVKSGSRVRISPSPPKNKGCISIPYFFAKRRHDDELSQIRKNLHVLRIDYITVKIYLAAKLSSESLLQPTDIFNRQYKKRHSCECRFSVYLLFSCIPSRIVVIVFYKTHTAKAVHNVIFGSVVIKLT